MRPSILLLLLAALAVFGLVLASMPDDAKGCSAVSCMGAPCSHQNRCASPRCGCAIREGQPCGRCVAL